MISGIGIPQILVISGVLNVGNKWTQYEGRNQKVGSPLYEVIVQNGGKSTNNALFEQK